MDQGVENGDVSLVMELMRGFGRGSAIRGRSCHNQRIERAWVDVWHGVTNVYHTLFAFLESRQLLGMFILCLSITMLNVKHSSIYPPPHWLFRWELSSNFQRLMFCEAENKGFYLSSPKSFKISPSVHWEFAHCLNPSSPFWLQLLIDVTEVENSKKGSPGVGVFFCGGN